MNWLIDLYWDVRFKIEDKISQWQLNREVAKLEKEDAPFVGEYNDNEISTSWEDEEVEVKPKKKKKTKKKSVKKTKKSV
jgi:hypothetical protein